jgi:3-oxoadipate enol-lactonase
MDFIEVNGTALRYDLSGRGTRTLVLVHEMGGTLESWDLVLPALAQGRRVLRYDTRGAGLSGKIGGRLAMETMVADLSHLLDALGMSEPVALAGTAVGAAIALAFAARHPERARALIVTSPATGVSGDRRAATLARATAVERGGMAAIAEAALEASWPPQLRTDAERFRRFRARWLGNDPASYAAINRMLAELTTDPSTIRCPTLVIAGRLDRLRPPESVEAVARAIPRAEFLVLETGHFMALQTPEPVAGAFGAFLGAHGL